MSVLVRIWRSEEGQATLEHLVVGAVAIIAIVALAALWRYTAQDGLPGLMHDSASHALNAAGGWVDVLLY